MGQRTSDIPPPDVILAATHGILYVTMKRGGRGLRQETIDQAERFRLGEPITFEEARKLRAWYARFSVNKPFLKSLVTNPTGPARVAWLLHGGDGGKAWAEEAYEYLIPLNGEL